MSPEKIEKAQVQIKAEEMIQGLKANQINNIKRHTTQ